MALPSWSSSMNLTWSFMRLVCNEQRCFIGPALIADVTHFSRVRSIQTPFKHRLRNRGYIFSFQTLFKKNTTGDSKPYNLTKCCTFLCRNTLGTTFSTIMAKHYPFSSNVFEVVSESDFAALKRGFLASATIIVDEERPSKRSKEASRKHCSYCGKQFASLAHVLRHERVHSGDRPFPCDICGKRFSQKGNLRTHRRRHEKALSKRTLEQAVRMQRQHSTEEPSSSCAESHASDLHESRPASPLPAPRSGLDMLLLAIQHKERPSTLKTSTTIISPPPSDQGDTIEQSRPTSPHLLAGALAQATSHGGAHPCNC
eukprot:m.170576 g.170576  ORF g.170576 m.170576 type:complete len:314 (+) comp16693_c1_seq1:3049-3990(+)